ncbi:MAG: ABC transporter permease, partial [Vicinamibacterales bacterium]
LPLQRGRNLTDEDGMTGRESAIINQRFAALHFPNEDPVGRRITLSIDLQGGAPPAGGIPTSLTATIVGIVPNVRQRDFQLPDPDPIAYLPFRTDPRGFMALIVRSQGDPTLMTPILREEVRAGVVAVPAPLVRATGDRTHARHRRCLWRRPAVLENQPADSDQLARSDHDRRHCDVARRRRDCRQRVAGEARDEAGSVTRPAEGLATD